MINELFTDAQRKQAIIAYLLKNPGCNKEKIINHLNNEGISSRKTTFILLNEMEKDHIIYLTKRKLNSRDSVIFLTIDNPITALYIEINEIRAYFDSLIGITLRNNPFPVAIPDIDYDARVKCISLLLCVLKLITSLINDILAYSFRNLINNESSQSFEKSYGNLITMISAMYVSFDKVVNTLDPKHVEYVSMFASNNDTPCKAFLWSLTIFYQNMAFSYKVVYTSQFKSMLFKLMEKIYNLGKTYTDSIYNEIIYDSSTYSNHIVGFPYIEYATIMKNELKNYDYRKYIKLLIERNQFVFSLKDSQAVKELNAIEKKLINELGFYLNGYRIFDELILNVIIRLHKDKKFVIQSPFSMTKVDIL